MSSLVSQHNLTSHWMCKFLPAHTLPYFVVLQSFRFFLLILPCILALIISGDMRYYHSWFLLCQFELTTLQWNCKWEKTSGLLQNGMSLRDPCLTHISRNDIRQQHPFALSITVSLKTIGQLQNELGGDLSLRMSFFWISYIAIAPGLLHMAGPAPVGLTPRSPVTILCDACKRT